MLVDPGVGETRLSHTRRCWNLLCHTNAIENKMTIIFLCQTIRIHPQQFSLSLVVEQGTTNFPLSISWKRMAGWYNNTNRNSNLHALRNCFVSPYIKILLFCKRICTRHWVQLYDFRVDHQTYNVLLMSLFSQTFKIIFISWNHNNDDDKCNKNALKMLDPEVIILVWSYQGHFN